MFSAGTTGMVPPVVTSTVAGGSLKSCHSLSTVTNNVLIIYYVVLRPVILARESSLLLERDAALHHVYDLPTGRRFQSLLMPPKPCPRLLGAASRCYYSPVAEITKLVLNACH